MSRLPFLSLTLFLLLVPTTAIMKVSLDDDARKNIKKLEDERGFDRVQGLSNTSIIASLLPSVPATPSTTAPADTLRGLAAHFADATSNGDTCFFSSDARWPESVAGFTALRGWPLSGTNCTSSTLVEPGNNLPPTKLALSPSAFMRLARAHRSATESLWQKIVARAAVADIFHRPTSIAWSYKTGAYLVCAVEKVTAVRYSSQWYILSRLTSAAPSVDEPDKQRFDLAEYVGVDADGFVEPLAQNLRPWRRGATEDLAEKRTGFATAIENWGGRATLSAVFSDSQASLLPTLVLTVEDSPALKQARGPAENAAGQAADALTYSSIAILALPMALSCVPVALLTDVTSFELTVYILATDVLAMVPFLIKGFELYLTGSKSYSAQEVWYSSVDDKPEIVVAEAFGAECKLEKLERIGAAFIAIGFIAIIFGFVIEWQAQRVRARWAASGKDLPSMRGRLRTKDLMRPEVRKMYGLPPMPPSNLDIAVEEQAFMENQIVPQQQIIAAPSRSVSNIGRLTRLPSTLKNTE